MKRQIIALFATFALCGGAAQAADNSTAAQTTIKTSRLRGVEAHSGFGVTIKQGPVSGAVISVDSRLQPYLRARVEEGVLVLGFDNLPSELSRKNLARTAKVTVVSLEKLKVHSGAEISGEGKFTAGDCEVDVHSGAQVRGVDLTAKSVEVEVHSGAGISMSGAAVELEVDTHSGAMADLSQLAATNVKAEASSGSEIKCWATHSISGRASSGASVRYKGTATQTNTGSSSGGSFGPMK